MGATIPVLIVTVVGSLGLLLLSFPASNAGALPVKQQISHASGPQVHRVVIDEANLSFQLPEGINQQEVPGATDSLVRLFEGPSLKILFDYGAYCDPMKEPVEGATGFQVIDEVVGGRPARIVTYHRAEGTGGHGSKYPYFTGIYFADVGRGRMYKLGVYANGQKPSDQAMALEIMRSLRFE